MSKKIIVILSASLLVLLALAACIPGMQAAPTMSPDMIGTLSAQTVTARLISNASSNYDLALRNAANATVRSSIRGVGLTDSITWTNAGGSAVNMYVRVKRVAGLTGSAGAYTLEVSR